jgi:S-formylglutathione hydrolase FrmB
LNELAKYRAKPFQAGAVDMQRLERGADRGIDDGRVKRFLAKVYKKVKLSGTEVHVLMNLCMAASYDPDPKAPNGFRLPFNLDTGEVIPARWQAWRNHDPVNLVTKYQKNLRSLRGIYIDCGWRDQYHIHYGTRILSKRLQLAGIKHQYEEFDDTHSDIDYRMDRSLPFLTRALR